MSMAEMKVGDVVKVYAPHGTDWSYGRVLEVGASAKVSVGDVEEWVDFGRLEAVGGVPAGRKNNSE